MTQNGHEFATDKLPDIMMASCIYKRGQPMKLNLFIVSLLIAAMPVCAQAQAPQPTQSPQSPKATQAPKAAKGSKETTIVATAQKVVKTISADKAKTQTYCDIGKLGDQIQEADKKNDMKKIDELNSKMEELAAKLGPDYVELIGGLDNIDPNSKVAQDIGLALDSLDKLCAK